MLIRLIQKEIRHHLLDFRFIAIFALCLGLSFLSVYVGATGYVHRLDQYSVVTEANRKNLLESLEKPGWRALRELRSRGFDWTRRPEPLSAVVFGLSGTQGREVHIQHLRLLHLGDSLFAVDAAYALFGILDFAFVVKLILSLCALLITYDAICGEKELGTLRLAMSFPVPKSTLALAKLIGGALAVLAPFVVAFLLLAAILSVMPSLSLTGPDWARLGALMGAFSLYVVVFAAFGIWVSALTQKRLTAFLGLLALWAVWIYIVPNVAVRAAKWLAPVESIYDLDRKGNALRWEVLQSRDAEQEAYDHKLPEGSLQALPAAQQKQIQQERERIDTKWDERFYTRLKDLQLARKNRMQRQQNLAAIFASVSPVGALSFLSQDLARTGVVQQNRLENALGGYLSYVAEFVRANRHLPDDEKFMTDFNAFSYRDTDTLAAALQRNVWFILNLALLALLGFAGAYVAILKYDVR